MKTLDAIYSERSGLNLQKSFYKKRDLVDVPAEVIIQAEDEYDASSEPGQTISKVNHNEDELVNHKSQNLLNQLLPSQVTVLGKRDKPTEEQTEEKEDKTSAKRAKTTSG